MLFSILLVKAKFEYKVLHIKFSKVNIVHTSNNVQSSCKRNYKISVANTFL